MNTTFALTISPPPNRYNKLLKNPLYHLYTEDMLYIKGVFSKHVKKCYLIPEMDPKGRLHYHGILTVDTHGYVSIYKSIKPRLERLGFVQLKKLEDFDNKLRWICYIRKDWHLTQRILEINEFIRLRALLPLKPKSIKRKSSLKGIDDYWGRYMILRSCEGPLGDTQVEDEASRAERTS